MMTKKQKYTHLILFSNHLNKRYIENVNPERVTVLLSKEQFTVFNYHQFRILYHISASVHFAKDNNIEYKYVERWEDFFGSLSKEKNYIYYMPNDIWMQNQIKEATRGFNIDIKKDLNFYFMNIEDEIGEPPYHLNPLYHRWRKKFNILMDGEKPIGGKFSYDVNNRKRPPKKLTVPDPLFFDMDKETSSIYDKVQEDFSNNPSSSQSFIYPVTTEDAKRMLKHFIENRLTSFGKYQDAMMEEHPFMVHSLLSASINLGLLYVKDVVKLIEEAYHNQKAPIESVEGFIRQIIGWREYIRGIYLAEMKNDYHLKNELNHTLNKPSFMYDADVSLRCLRLSINETLQHAYNHHIQRLMIIGNVTNLMGISPHAIREWFNEMYIDSFDWVVTPNVIGMAMYADGGMMSTKPYISSANYINKMSDYCKSCRYNPKEKYSENACPINAFYYNFLDEHKEKFERNARMRYMYLNLNKLSSNELESLKRLTKRVMIKETTV